MTLPSSLSTIFSISAPISTTFQTKLQPRDVHEVYPYPGFNPEARRAQGASSTELTSHYAAWRHQIRGHGPQPRRFACKEKTDTARLLGVSTQEAAMPSR